MEPSDPNLPMTGPPETTIVIRTFNEQKYLESLFQGIARQAYRDFETVVVDSGSFDFTRDIARKHADRLIKINKHDFTFGYSLNTGIEAASGKFIVIISAHTLPTDEHWLGNLIEPLRDQKVAMTFGRQMGIRSSKFSEAEDLDRHFGPVAGVESLSDLRVNNANSAICKDLWEGQGFDETLTGLEDIGWAHTFIKKGFEVHYVPTAGIYHIHEESWRQIHNRYYREAVALRHMGLKSGGNVGNVFVREFMLTFSDLLKTIGSRSNPVLDRLTRFQSFREVFYFRFHKAMGTVQGLIRTHALETRESQEEILYDKQMSAVVISGPKKATYAEIAVPTVRPGEVLVQVAYVAVCATDLEVYTGSLGYFESGLSAFPIVPGHEFSGTIVSVGQNVARFATGDRVTVESIQSCGHCDSCLDGNFIACAERSEVGVMKRNGAYAEYMATPAQFVHKLPERLNMKAASLVEPTAVVLKGLQRIERYMNDEPSRSRCAVIGAGPIGQLCARVLSHRGFDVTVVDRNPKRLACFEGTAINPCEDLSELASAHIVVEATGNADLLDQVLKQTAPNTVHLLLGLPYGDRAFSFETITAYDKIVVGSVGSAKEDFEMAIDLLPDLDLTPFFACIKPLAAYADAWDASQSGSELKVLLEPMAR